MFRIILLIVTIALIVGIIIGSIKNNPLLTVICVKLLIISTIFWGMLFVQLIGESDLPFWVKFWLLS